MTFASLVSQLIGLVNLAVPLVVGLTLAAFIWQGVRTFFPGDTKEIKKHYTFFLWGIFAIFVMVSLWGILNILSGIFFSGGATGTTDTTNTGNDFGDPIFPSNVDSG